MGNMKKGINLIKTDPVVHKVELMASLIEETPEPRTQSINQFCISILSPQLKKKKA